MTESKPRQSEQRMPVVFILGILPRSGTNFLCDLLCRHPDCVYGGIIHEDFSLAHVGCLDRYVDRTYADYGKEWQVPSQITRKTMLRNLGHGLQWFLCEQLVITAPEALKGDVSSKRLVTKTPSVKHISRFFELFPDAYLLILVRDGRSVVESGVRSFDWVRHRWTQRWAQAADEIGAFAEKHGADKRYRIVKYEEIFRNQAAQLRDLFTFLDLDPEAYDYEDAKQVPVLGSSEARNVYGQMTWKPMEATKDFDPLRRWANWSRARHERFNHLAGEQLQALGYEPKRYNGFRLAWFVWNRLLDMWWFFRDGPKRVKTRISRALGRS